MPSEEEEKGNLPSGDTNGKTNLPEVLNLPSLHLNLDSAFKFITLTLCTFDSTLYSSITQVQKNSLKRVAKKTEQSLFLKYNVFVSLVNNSWYTVLLFVYMKLSSAFMTKRASHSLTLFIILGIDHNPLFPLNLLLPSGCYAAYLKGTSNGLRLLLFFVYV